MLAKRQMEMIFGNKDEPCSPGFTRVKTEFPVRMEKAARALLK
jgi:hypothetical protein